MLGRVDTGAVLGSRAVDAQFWALVCEDEELLDAEFYAVVSDAFEAPISPIRPTRTSASSAAWPQSRRWAIGNTRPWRTGARPGRHWQRERGPPP